MPRRPEASPCVSSLATVPLITESQSSWGSGRPVLHTAYWTIGLFPGGEAASGRCSGGGASFLQSVPRYPMSACGGQGRVAERTPVARGWQGQADLIQLARRPPLPCNSGPSGLRLPAAALCAQSPCIWIRSLPLGSPNPASGTCGLLRLSPPPDSPG